MTKKKCFAEIQANLPSFSKYSNSSSRAADINRAVAGFIVSGMKRLGIVDNLEFKLLLHKLDPRYVFFHVEDILQVRLFLKCTMRKKEKLEKNYR